MSPSVDDEPKVVARIDAAAVSRLIQIIVQQLGERHRAGEIFSSTSREIEPLN